VFPRIEILILFSLNDFHRRKQGGPPQEAAKEALHSRGAKNSSG
jgi:hypothetical protein